jgi:AAA15 family ATPase/GTPase
MQESCEIRVETTSFMLIAFSVQNFKSIRDLQTLSLEARSDDHLAWSNVIEDGKLRLVKTAAVYGPNASGKSNLVEAMVWFRNFVIESSKDSQAGETIGVQPFLLSSETENAPSHFEVEFRWQGFDYRYGFEITSKAVESEWLYRKSPSAKEAKLFTREGQDFDVSAAFFKEGKGLEPRTRPNALFLSVCAQFNGDEAGKVLAWMRRFRHVSGLDEMGFFAFTAERLQDPKHREKLLELAKKADFNIQSLRSVLEQITEAKLPPEMPAEMKKRVLGEKFMSADIKTTHQKLGADHEVIGEVEFDLTEDESSGTQKFIALSGPIMHTLEEGSILLVDELEARLHPRLTQAILDLFHSPVNRRNAQLVCATHDVTLLDPERFRRDQVWFCEKDATGATDLFTLADIDSNLVRPTSKFSRQYMLGLFGAVPQLAHFQEAAAHATE